MATERRLIDANAFLKALNERPLDFLDVGGDFGYFDETIDSVMNEQPTVDAVSRGVLDQVRWERDVAIKQLEDHGIPFGGIAPDVVKVVRCKDCKQWIRNSGIAESPNGHCFCHDIVTNGHDFCSYGERRTDNEDNS